MGELTLVDTSVWIEFLRRPVDTLPAVLGELIATETAAMCAPIEMELLLGPTDEVSLRRVERLVASQATLAIRSDTDFTDAAEIYRAVRRTGRTVRNSVDCLIAAIAIRHDVPLLHRDADFTVIGEVTELRGQSLLGD